MRLTVRLWDIPKLDNLIEDNEFIRKVIKPDQYGGWFVDTDKIQEVERLLKKSGIRYKIKNDN